MSLFLTVWLPSSDLVGVPSILAVVLCIAGVLLTERQVTRDDLIRVTLAVVLPWALFAFVVCSKVPVAPLRDLSLPWQGYRQLTSLADYIANYTYLAFALLLSLRVWQSKSWPFRVLGAAQAALFALFIVSEGRYWYERLSNG